MLHIPSFFNFLRSLLHFQLSSHSFIHCCLWSTHPGFPVLLLQSRRNPSWTHNFCILQTYNINTNAWSQDQSPACIVTGSSWIMAPGASNAWIASIMNWILGSKLHRLPFWNTVTWIFLFKGNFFIFVIMSLQSIVLWLIPSIPLSHFPIGLIQRTWLSITTTKLSSVSSLQVLSFWQNWKLFK